MTLADWRTTHRSMARDWSETLKSLVSDASGNA